MDLLIVMAIVMFVIFGNLGKKVQKEQQRKQSEPVEAENRQMTFDTAGDYRAFREPTKESQKASWHSSRRTTTQTVSSPSVSARPRANRMMPKTGETPKEEKSVISERAQDIQERRINQHENAKKKRIHQNIHRDDEKEIEVTPSDLMHNIRDLIVCGYPTEIKEQRDFIKEGEDFLNSLSGDSLFF